MQKRTFIAAGAAVIAAVAGLVGFTNQSQAQNISLQALSGEALVNDPSMLLVDIRRPEEWQQTGVIDGALLLTYTDADSFLAAVTPKLAEGQKIALICRTGNRTSRAANQIAARTTAPIVDVQGGMMRVLGEGFRPVKPTREMGCSAC